MALQGKCFYSHREGRTEALGRFGHVGSGNILRASLRRSVCELDRVYSSDLANLARHAARAFSYRRCLSRCSCTHCGVTGTRIAGRGSSINSSSTVSIEAQGKGSGGSAVTPPASSGPPPALRFHPWRALSSVVAVSILSPPASAIKRKIPGGFGGTESPQGHAPKTPLFPLPTGPAPVG